ncbi:MAG: M48 family metallopeptidase [Phycisphaeraceae bacterium]|nr:M48 family metallopeptidase [Phycisphaeraceae bacterium]
MLRCVRSVFYALTILLAIGVALPGCKTNPATGRSQMLALSRTEEIRIGAENAPALTQEFGGAVPSPELQAYVRDIGNRLAEVTEADFPTLPWEFTLLDSKVINAFALPGGKVFISRGLTEEMTNEAQLAAVLGHEIGHVTARHTSERFAQATLTTIGGAVIGGLIGAAAGDGKGTAIGAGAAAGATVGQVASLSFSRDQEVEADRLGMRYMERIKYDPVGAIEVQQILARAGGGGGGVDWFSTHPSSSRRISELQERLNKYYAHTVNNPEFSRHEARFQNQFLSRVKTLPPPRHTMIDPQTLGGFGALAFGPIGEPHVWCMHCRAEREATVADERSLSVTVADVE